MTTAKHTPEVWVWGTFGAGLLVVRCHPDGSPDKHRPVCNLRTQYTYPLDKETVANANLITAAPELLEALLANHQWHLGHDDHDGYPGSELEAQNIAAIAKATGETK